MLTSTSSPNDQGDPRSSVDETATAAATSTDPRKSDQFILTDTTDSHHDLVSIFENYSSVVVDTGSTRYKVPTCALGTSTLSPPSCNIILASGQGDTADSNIGKESLNRTD